jgi:hypothetical protein
LLACLDFIEQNKRLAKIVVLYFVLV